MKQPKQTKRKFYGKWVYKVSLHLPGAPIFRHYPIHEAMNFVMEISDGFRAKFRQDAWNNRENIQNYIDTISSYNKDQYCVRIETNTLDVYTNERSLYDELSFNCIKSVNDRSEPGDAEEMLNSGYTVVAKKYPHDKYRHKVFLQPHKLAHNKEEKIKYINWLNDQGEKVLITDTVKQWFMTTDWNWDRRYIYVDNDQTLLMLKLRNPEVMGRVYDYVLSDK